MHPADTAAQLANWPRTFWMIRGSPVSGTGTRLWRSRLRGAAGRRGSGPPGGLREASIERLAARVAGSTTVVSSGGVRSTAAAPLARCTRSAPACRSARRLAHSRSWSDSPALGAAHPPWASDSRDPSPGSGDGQRQILRDIAAACGADRGAASVICFIRMPATDRGVEGQTRR